MPWHCRFCDKYFQRRKLLDEHINTLHKSIQTLELYHACENCGEKFAWYGDLKRHVASTCAHTALKVETNAQCDTCGKIVKKVNFKEHVLTHSTEKPFSCQTCGLPFVSQRSLAHHFKKHLQERSFECHICKKRFNWPKVLKSHIKIIHMKDKPLACKYCDKKFSARSILKYHIRSHTNEQPHQCTFCGKRFSMTQGLKRHLRMHTKEKPYICRDCGRTFAKKQSLKYHDPRCSKKKVLQGESDKMTM